MIGRYELPRINVAALFQAPLVTRALDRARIVTNALDLLDAVRLEVTPEGAVRLR